MNRLQKVKPEMGCSDWHTAIHSFRPQRLLRIYCPGHAGVSGNERADRLASTTVITFGLQLGRAELLRGLRNFLNMDRPEHHSIDRLTERGVKKRKRPREREREGRGGGGRQTDRQTETDRQTDGRTDGQTDEKTDRQTKRQTDR